jgi:hypothetical protein
MHFLLFSQSEDWILIGLLMPACSTIFCTGCTWTGMHQEQREICDNKKYRRFDFNISSGMYFPACTNNLLTLFLQLLLVLAQLMKEFGNRGRINSMLASYFC